MLKDLAKKAIENSENLQDGTNEAKKTHSCSVYQS